MHKARSKRVPFKKAYTNKVKWYTVYNFSTVEDFMYDVTPKIQRDFQLDSFELVVAGQNNEINGRAEEEYSLYPSSIYCEYAFGANLDVCFYIRPY